MSPWTVGDLIAVLTSVAYTPLELAIKPGLRNASGIVQLLGTGISLGTLLLVLLDPFRQMAGYHTSLLQIALNEGRATLWVGAAVAVVYLVKDLFSGEGGGTG